MGSIGVAFVLLLVQDPPVAGPLPTGSGTSDEASRGPAAAESALSSLLAQLAAGVDTTAEALEAVERTEATAGTDGFAADLQVACSLVRHLVTDGAESEISSLPSDPALLRRIARELPLATPAALAPRLEEQVGHRTEHGVALVELLAKAPAGASVPALHRLLERGRRGSLPAPVQAAVLAELSWRGGVAELPALVPLLEEPAPAIRYFARQASGWLIEAGLRADRFVAVAEHFEEQERRQPPGLRSRLEAAGALLQEPSAQTIGRARAHLEKILEAVQGRVDTDSLVLAVTANLGLAVAAFLDEDGPRDAVHDWIGRATDLPRAPLEREDTLNHALLRAEVVAALLAEIRGEPARDELLRVLRKAPSEDDSCFLDRACFGAFGVAFLERPMRRSGRAAQLVDALLVLVEAIEQDGPRAGFGLLERDPEQDERPASWQFLQAARALLEDRGDPDATRELLRPRIEALQSMHRWDNLQLLVEAYLLDVRAAMYQWRGAEAAAAANAAREVAASLRVSARRDWLEQRDRGELPPPPPDQLRGRAVTPFAALEGRVLLVRANVAATALEDAGAAARDLQQVCGLLPWSQRRWLTVALDQARRGLHDWARRSLACVEPGPHNLYDRACVAAWLGSRDESVALLEEHLRRQTFTPEGRALEISMMRRDPDLESVRAHPRFPRQP